MNELNDTLDWTTDDEKAYVDGLFHTALSSRSLAGLRAYARTVTQRRWDDTVDPDLVMLHVNQRISDVKLLTGATFI